MNKAILLGSFALAALALSVSIAPGQAGKKSDSVVKLKAKLDKTAAGKEVVVLNLDIEAGWHLYANPVGIDDLDTSQVVVKIANIPARIDYPVGKVVDDPQLGKYKIYEDKIEIRATLDRPAGSTSPIEVSVKLQSCNEKLCLPPATVKLMVP